jgi:NADPH-dependent ferric siderophore reductase
MQKHQIRRMRLEARRRSITVARIEHITPRLVRVTFTSNELADFSSPAHDDHIKVFFPAQGEQQCMRDFTPRAFDVDAGTLVVDFALHDNGPSMKWVSSVQVGETIEIGGPRGSTVVPDDFDWYLLVGDETALPAIGRRVEELRIGVPVTTVVTVANAAEKQVWQTPASWNPIWILRDEITANDDMAALRTSLADCRMPPGDGMVWVAAETSVVRAFYAHMLNDRHHPRAWIKAAGYWTRGQSDSHERIGE